jgi:hypothetical protein
MTRDNVLYFMIGVLTVVVAVLVYRLLEENKEAGKLHISGSEAITFGEQHLEQIRAVYRHANEPRSL